MKYLKPTLLILLIAIPFFLVYFAYNYEEWPNRKNCKECDDLEMQKQEQLRGTVEMKNNGKTVFTDQLTRLTYNLKPCDSICEDKKMLPFSKIGVIDYTTKKSVYFEIEGKYILEKDEFVYSFIIVLNEREFVNVKEITGVPFDELPDYYTTLEKETFMLNESHYAGLRNFLPHYFSEEQLKQPIPLMEATWETSDSTLITIWFQEKPSMNNKWIPIEQYEWKKGMEF